MPPIQDMFEQSSDAVFGIDQQRRIAYSNIAFRKLVKKDAAEFHGFPCYDVLCADDLSDRRVCHQDCPIAHRAMRQQPMSNFDLVLPRDDEPGCWVNVGIYPAPAATVTEHPTCPRVYFSLRRMNGHRLIQRLANERPMPGKRLSRPALTRRETQALELACLGRDTVGISHELSISPQTVRNHFKNIFAKLEVRSRAQAVARALQEQLV
jgi:DNA-binding CsgD family transcriptional regulator